MANNEQKDKREAWASALIQFGQLSAQGKADEAKRVVDETSSVFGEMELSWFGMIGGAHRINTDITKAELAAMTTISSSEKLKIPTTDERKKIFREVCTILRGHERPDIIQTFAACGLLLTKPNSTDLISSEAFVTESTNLLSSDIPGGHRRSKTVQKLVSKNPFSCIFDDDVADVAAETAQNVDYDFLADVAGCHDLLDYFEALLYKTSDISANEWKELNYLSFICCIFMRGLTKPATSFRSGLTKSTTVFVKLFGIKLPFTTIPFPENLVKLSVDIIFHVYRNVRLLFLSFLSYYSVVDETTIDRSIKSIIDFTFMLHTRGNGLSLLSLFSRCVALLKISAEKLIKVLSTKFVKKSIEVLLKGHTLYISGGFHLSWQWVRVIDNKKLMQYSFKDNTILCSRMCGILSVKNPEIINVFKPYLRTDELSFNEDIQLGKQIYYHFNQQSERDLTA